MLYAMRAKSCISYHHHTTPLPLRHQYVRITDMKMFNQLKKNTAIILIIDPQDLTAINTQNDGVDSDNDSRVESANTHNP